MVDRYTISSSAEWISQVFGSLSGTGFGPIYNAAPTRQLPILLASKPREIVLAKWGLISGLSNNKAISARLFNLSSDLAFEKTPYQRMIATKRAVILADGFFLWKQVSKKQRVPYYFYLKDRKPFGIGAVWEQDDFDPQAVPSFNMLTQSARGSVREYQEDMPLILSEKSLKDWLDSASTVADLKNSLSDADTTAFSLHPVSPLISDISQEGESLIKPSQPSDQYGNYTLFN